MAVSLLLSGFVQAFFGYMLGHMCMLLGLFLLWSQARTNGSPGLMARTPMPVERTQRTNPLQAVASTVPVLIYVGAAVMSLVRANLALDTRRTRRSLRHARRT